MIKTRYNLHDEVSLKWWTTNLTVHEISIDTKGIEYKLWEQWTNNYTRYQDYQIADKMDKVWFKV